MSKHTLSDWSARLGIVARVPMVAVAVAAAPGLDAQAGKTADMSSSDMVVINHEEQYGLWPASVEVPRGWASVSKAASASAAAEQLRELGGADIVYIVVNHEEQYGVWSKGEGLPTGWRDTGRTCKVSACAKTLTKMASSN